MSRESDQEARRWQIIQAGIDAIAEGGFAGLTLRRVASRLGGSVALITHYFGNRDQLIAGMLEGARGQAREEMAALTRIEDPIERLVSTMLWFLPLDETGMTLERARIALLSERSLPAVDRFIEAIEPAMRSVLMRGVEDFVSESSVDDTVELLRAWCNGIAVSAVENPKSWTRERQLRSVRTLMRLLGIPDADVDSALHRQGADSASG